MEERPGGRKTRAGAESFVSAEPPYPSDVEEPLRFDSEIGSEEGQANGNFLTRLALIVLALSVAVSGALMALLVYFRR